MRYILTSTLASTAADDGTMSEEELERVAEALAANGVELRVSRSVDESVKSTVTAFTGALGTELWAVANGDEANTETVVHDDRHDAEREYENLVRELAQCADSPWWDESDVPQIALAAITYTEESRGEDGCWRTVREMKGRLSGAEMGTVADAAAVLLSRITEDQDGINRLSALEAAIGMRPAGSQVTCLRVTVRGTIASGPVTHVSATAFEPVRPTGEEIAAYRELVAQAAEDAYAADLR
ncbi:hypothetical protein PUR49_32445 [Streptomyces sp. BE147]|uniref:hypothetical protein n=1 Tax=Streptomyces sp. BE147 TaxID=3002524 RepID=UPI002E782C14|nr:hypothetical protein [Streptomyces sp. BE147]MEE1741183.1 hypothetical protein [Streptomyces sp. BE147]